VAATVAHSFPVNTPGKESYHVSPPFLIAAIILLAPLQLVALIGILHVAEQLRKRRSLFAQVFNAAAYTVTCLAAQALYRAIWPVSGDLIADLGQPACLVAGIAAAVAFALLNRVLVSVAIWLGNRISPRDQHIFEPEGMLVDGILLLMGLPLAHLTLIAPWAAAVGAAPLWLIHRVLDLPNMRAQSRQDGLTELFTAPYLTETCTRELNRGRRFNRPVSLLLIDIDGLGELNARHGHQAGDAVLRGTARAVRRATREYDLAARLAGGLFAILLPETDLAQAQLVAERIRRGTADRPHEIPNSVEQARITVSVGGAVVHGQNATAAQFFEAANAALSSAKRDGGNQIEFVAVQAAALVAVPTDGEIDDQSPVELVESVAAEASVAQDSRQRSQAPGFARSVLTLRGVLLGGLAGLGLAVWVVGSIATLDWAMLGVMASLAALAGFTFYFKTLPLAVKLAGELHRSPARLWAARVVHVWPQYLALGAIGLLVAYAYASFGALGAATIIAAALLFRQLAGRYVDRTLDSVRKLRNANEQLEHQAFHDPLTNLANRALFAERLEHAMVRTIEGSVAVLFLDLDNFKTVNDSLGHAVGDALLISATERLLQCVRREDTIGRFGGDEFTVLLESMRDPSDAARMAERIGEALRTPFEVAGQQVVISSSIGIALDTDRTHAPDDLMREADLAMYRAKSGGKARYEIFDTGMASRATERLELETELRRAATRGELLLHYQPVVDLASGSIDAVEALLRWKHPRHGLMPAIEFLSVADETGVILDLGRWALNQACRDAVEWQPLRPGLVVHVNLSARQLEYSELSEDVSAALQQTGLPAACLRLEVPESALAHDGKSAAVVLDTLDELGVRLALDDVGGGASSLAWLSRMPVDVLKIGAAAAESPALVRASVALGAALGMTVTAQGVDQADQAARLSAFGCRHAQGFLFGAPQEAAGITSLLAGTESSIRVA
jgi:diguanylate cyclase (GGDEF)-like protein